MTEKALSTRLAAASLGTTFRSRMAVGRLTADFGSYDAKVIVEIDGAMWDDAHQRTTAFEFAGYLVLRFSEDEVLADIDGVVATIAQAMAVWNG